MTRARLIAIAALLGFASLRWPTSIDARESNGTPAARAHFAEGETAIKARNYPVIQGGVMFVAIIVVFVNLIVDLSYGLLNPKIRLS